MEKMLEDYKNLLNSHPLISSESNKHIESHNKILSILFFCFDVFTYFNKIIKDLYKSIETTSFSFIELKNDFEKVNIELNGVKKNFTNLSFEKKKSVPKKYIPISGISTTSKFFVFDSISDFSFEVNSLEFNNVSLFYFSIEYIDGHKCLCLNMPKKSLDGSIIYNITIIQ